MTSGGVSFPVVEDRYSSLMLFSSSIFFMVPCSQMRFYFCRFDKEILVSGKRYTSKSRAYVGVRKISSPFGNSGLASRGGLIRG